MSSIRFWLAVILQLILIQSLYASISKASHGADMPANVLKTLYEGGYASSLSVNKGDSITFYISTYSPKFSLNIYRYGKTKDLVETINNIEGKLQLTPDSSYYYGCNWKPTVKIRIPENWKAGMYLAEFPARSDTVNPVFFIVKEPDRSKRSSIAVNVSFNTVNAYNNFGGKCSYPAYSSGKLNSVRLSFLRPVNRNIYNGVCRANFFVYEGRLIRWLESNGYNADVYCDPDLDADSTYLKDAKVLIFAGHNEYWSMEMRKHVEDFVRSGGNLMILGGNTCWWQVRYENGHNTMVCYKSDNDPIKTKLASLRTNKWIKINRENSLTGLSYEKGGDVNYGPVLNYSLGYGGYIVHNDQHWVFQGADLKNGQIFGCQADSSIVGYEVDATLFKYFRGIPVVTGTDKTPQNFRILGLSPANSTKPPVDKPTPDLFGVMGIYKSPGNGGVVFNAGTIRWVFGLSSPSSKVPRITQNVLNRFLQNRFPPEIINWSPSTVRDTTELHLSTEINRRDIRLQYGTTLAFSVDAVDYNGKNINYIWKINDTLFFGGRAINYYSLNHQVGFNKVTLYVFNDQDTSSISWNVRADIGSGIAIAGPPDSLVYLGQSYNFTLNSFDYFHVPVSYRILYRPEWAKYDSTRNVISGIPDRTGRDSLIIKATDKEGHQADKVFKLNVIEFPALNSIDKSPGEYYLFQNYPNPFNSSTKITFYLKDRTDVDLSIFDIQGKKVRSFEMTDLSLGYHFLTWNGKDDSDQTVSSGIYLCYFQISIKGQILSHLVVKMSLLK